MASFQVSNVKRDAVRAQLVTAAACLTLCASHATFAADHVVETIGWGDLTVKVEFEDPFEALSQEQLMDLSIYARLEEMRKRAPEKVSEGMAKEAETAAQTLREQGVDIEGLLKRREEIRQLRAQRASAKNPELDGKTIKMPGYALPLEYDGKKVTEFLLVPWVGACIHTPPPPPNQIVYVALKEGFEVRSRFEPVWVNGDMSIGGMSKKLFLVDGSAQINVGYSVKGAMAERYEALAARPVPRRGRAHN